MADKMARRGIFLYIDGTQVKNSAPAVTAELKKIRAEQNKLIIGSEEYVRKGKQIRQLDSVLREHKAQLRESKVELQGMNKETTTWKEKMMKMAGVIASITGIAYAINKITLAYETLMESESDVRKYTGLTSDQVKELNEDFKKMDTRTSRIELNKLAAEAGKLGIEGKDKILEFVDAANIIKTSLGEDLGEDAILQIGKMADMFGDKSKSMKENMLAIGSAINQVGQNSSAQEGYLVDFSARMTGVSGQTNIAASDLIGFAAVLDKNMQQAEASSTALDKVILKMFQDPALFAEMAGKEVTDFTNLLKTDTNEAVLQFLESLNKKGGLDKLAPMFKDMKLDGEKASSTLSVLATNIEDVRIQQESASKAYAEGTSVINEYNVKNNTQQAQREKAIKVLKEITYALGEKLSPAVTAITGKAAGFAKILIDLIDVITDNWRMIVTATTAIAGYSVVMGVASIATKAFTTITKGAAVASASLNAALKMTPAGWVATGVGLAAGAIAFFTSKTNAARDAQKQFTKELITEQTEAQSLFAQLKRTNEGTDERKKLIDTINSKYGQYLANLITEKTDLSNLSGAINEVNEGLKKTIGLRIKNEAIGDVSANYVKKISDYYDIISQMIEKKTKSAEIAALYTQRINEMVAAGTTDQYAIFAKLKTEFGNDEKLTGPLLYNIQQITNEAKKYKKEVADIDRKFGFLGKEAVPVTETPKTPEQLAAEAEAERLKQEAERLKQEQAENERQAKLAAEQAAKERKANAASSFDIERAQLKTQYATGQVDYDKYQSELTRIQRSELESRRDKAVKGSKDQYAAIEALADLDIKQQEEQTKEQLDATKKATDAAFELRKREAQTMYADGKMNKEAYEQALTTIELEHLKASIANTKAGSDERAAAEAAYLDAVAADKVKKQEETEKKIADIRKKYVTQTDEETKQEFLTGLEQAHASGIISEEEYQEAISRIHKQGNEDRVKAFTESISVMQGVLSAYGNYVSAEQDYETAKVNAKYDKLIKAAGDNSEEVTKLEAKKEKELAKVKSEYADRQMKIQILQAIAQTATGAIAAYSSAAAVPVIGYILAPIAAAAAVAAGMLQVASIKKQAQAAKLTGYSSGGYTKRGQWDEPAGIVHSDEFVANRFATANPTLRGLFDVIDYAQRAGTVSSLTSSQLSEALSGKNTTQTVNVSTPTPVSSPSQDNTILLSALYEATETMKAVREQLETPLAAYTYITGKGGSEEAQQEYDRMKKNKSRS